MRFSVVIPTRNRAEHVVKMIQHLLLQRYPPKDFEIIVVNNGTDDTVSRIQHLSKGSHQLLLGESKTGPSFARNRGYMMAHFPFIVFLDDDIRVHPDFLTHVADAWKTHPGASYLGGRIIPHSTALGDSLLAKRKHRLLCQKYNWIYAYIDYGKRPKIIKRNELLCSAIISIRKPFLYRSGPFDTKLGRPYLGVHINAEEFELTNWLLSKNKHVWYVPQIKGYHAFDANRFSSIYILMRHITAGAERYLMDKLLSHKCRSFQNYTYISSVWFSLREALQQKNIQHLTRFKDPMKITYLCSYCILGPLLYLITIFYDLTRI